MRALAQSRRAIATSVAVLAALLLAVALALATRAPTTIWVECDGVDAARSRIDWKSRAVSDPMLNDTVIDEVEGAWLSRGRMSQSRLYLRPTYTGTAFQRARAKVDAWRGLVRLYLSTGRTMQIPSASG